MVNIHRLWSTVEESRHRLGLARFSAYIGDMDKRLIAPLFLAICLTPAPALAGAGGFNVVNGTGAGISSLSIRRTGTSDWTKLSATPAPGASSSVAFSDPDCAFDLRASLAGGGTAEWNGVNLCGTSQLTLRRRPSGETWVDYD